MVMLNDCLSAKMMRMSDQMLDLAQEMGSKYHLDAIELSGAAMILADWAMEVKREESSQKKSEECEYKDDCHRYAQQDCEHCICKWKEPSAEHPIDCYLRRKQNVD